MSVEGCNLSVLFLSSCPFFGSSPDLPLPSPDSSEFFFFLVSFVTLDLDRFLLSFPPYQKPLEGSLFFPSPILGTPGPFLFFGQSVFNIFPPREPIPRSMTFLSSSIRKFTIFDVRFLSSTRTAVLQLHLCSSEFSSLRHSW